MAVVPGGKPAVTHYRVRERFAAHTLLECDLETGRTHQIRVHLASIGHPLEGDPVYGGRGARAPAAPGAARVEARLRPSGQRRSACTSRRRRPPTSRRWSRRCGASMKRPARLARSRLARAGARARVRDHARGRRERGRVRLAEPRDELRRRSRARRGQPRARCRRTCLPARVAGAGARHRGRGPRCGDATAGRPRPIADAAVTSRPGRVAVVLTADCLPVFLCREDGSRVAVAHAGWRGLAAGVLENAVAALGGRRVARAGLAGARDRAGRVRGRPRGARGVRRRDARRPPAHSGRIATTATSPTSMRSRAAAWPAQACAQRLRRRLLHLHRDASASFPTAASRRAGAWAPSSGSTGRVDSTARLFATQSREPPAMTVLAWILAACLAGGLRLGPARRPRRVPGAGAPGADPRELRGRRAPRRGVPRHHPAPLRADDRPRRDGRARSSSASSASSSSRSCCSGATTTATARKRRPSAGTATPTGTTADAPAG